MPLYDYRCEARGRGATTLVAPVSYQGGKIRLASAVLQQIAPDPETTFYDLCCGCGAISIELINKGRSPSSLVMLDQGPWGLFWEAVGNGTFDLACFESHCKAVPVRAKINQYMESLASQPAHFDTLYVFLLLQASAFGGKAVWIENDCWINPGFRTHWMPTAVSVRRSPVNPMSPLPYTLFLRVKAVCEQMRGVHGHCMDIHKLTPKDGTVYIDPPYANTVPYGYTFDVQQYVESTGRSCYVSEKCRLSDTAWLLSTGQKKGGITGNRKAANEEWLSLCTPRHKE